MPLWGKIDQANNTPVYVGNLVKITPNTANRDAMYGNTTADAFITNETVGVYAITGAELTAGNNATLATVAVAHGGNNYAPGDLLGVNGGTYSVQATINVTATEVRAATVEAGGTGYANGDVITIANGVGTAATFTVTTGAADSIATTLAVTSAGRYTTNPTLSNVATTNSTGSGTGARINLVMKIREVEIANSGLYTVLPTEANNQVANLTGVGVSANIDLTFTDPSVTSAGISHTGWVLRREGTGGRAGRVHNEVLVAGGITKP